MRRRNRGIKGMVIPLLCLGLVFCTSAVYAALTGGGSLNNFQKRSTYPSQGLSDVQKEQWFYDDVKTVYEYGLMVGNSATTFNPSGNVTIAETITVAVRLHALYYTGSNTFDASDPWYQTYVNYAYSNGIINAVYDEMNRPATRAEYATILSAAFPDVALEAINQIEDNYIPDVKMNVAYSDAVYRLYRAGVLIGNDDKGTFSPTSNITRSEVAAIISRMASTDKRIVKNTQTKTSQESFDNDKIDTSHIEAAIHNPSFVLSSNTVKRGAKDVPVTVALRKNPGIASIGLTVSFGNDLTLKNVKYTDTFAPNAVLPQKMSNPVKLIWVAGTKNVEGDWTLATLYFDVAEDASVGPHQIAAVYDEDDVFRVNNEEPFEENVPFEVVFGSINVTG